MWGSILRRSLSSCRCSYWPQVYMHATKTGQKTDKMAFEVILCCPWKSPLVVTLHFCRRVYLFFLQFCTFSRFVFAATFLCLKTNTAVYLYVFLSECESYQHRKKNSVSDRTPRFSVIFPIDFLLLSFLHSQGMECLNWSRPVKESVSDRETDRTRGNKKREWRGKMKGDDVEKKRRNRKEPLLGHRGPSWPLTLIMTLEVTPEVRGCVKVPLRRFTPLLCDDDLMQPPQPVWHDQCCSLPAAPKRHTSISNPATQGPLKAPYRQSQWAGGKGTQTEKSG